MRLWQLRLFMFLLFVGLGWSNAFTVSLHRVKKEETTRLFNIKFYKELLNFGHGTLSEKGLWNLLYFSSSVIKNFKCPIPSKFLFNFNFLSNLLDLTCFTCGKTSSNEECNKNAVDEPCTNANLTQAGHVSNINKIACMTVHAYNYLNGETISIEKKCALDCTPQMVGCSNDVKQPNARICTYCCNKNYCNMDVAKTQQQAISLGQSLIADNQSSSNRVSYFYLNFIIVLIVKFSFY